MHDSDALATLKHLLETGKNVIKKKCVATLDGKIISTHVFDLNRDHEPELITSLKGGAVRALTLSGDILWTFDANDNVFGISATEMAADYGNIIAIGSDDGSVYLINSLGQQIWSYKAPRWISSVVFYPLKSTDDMLICAGCDDGSVYGLDITGELKWRFRSSGKIKRLRIADIDHDGVDEILAISYDKHIYVLDSFGHQKRIFHTKNHAGREFQVADVNKDGLKEIVVTTFHGYVYLLSNSGEVKWRYKTRGKPRTLFVGDIDRDRNVEIVVGSEGGFLHILTANGELKWTEQFHTRYFFVDSSWQFAEPRLLLGIENSLYLLEIKQSQGLPTKIRDAFSIFGLLEPLKSKLDLASYEVLTNVILSNHAPTPPEMPRLADRKLTMDKSLHVFISYVRDDTLMVQRLCVELNDAGINVWLDRNNIFPGERWRRAIRRAIIEGACFIACFSEKYAQRTSTYMNEEILLAIDELRQHPNDRVWFIPIKLTPCEIPDRQIGGGETLLDLQYVELFDNWTIGLRNIISTIQSVSQHSEKGK